MGKIIYRNKGSKENIVISIAGPHGVGKTTIYTLFKKKVEGNSKFKFFPERYVKNPPFPFGSRNKQTAFRSEFHFLQQLVKRNGNVLKYDNKYNGRILILDRTSLCVLIYSKGLNLKEKDYKLILDMYNSVNWREDYIIYLTADSDTILKRILQRGSLEKIRREWNETEKKYLLTILSYYNQFLQSKNYKDKTIIIDTDKLTLEDVLKKIELILINLSGYSFRKLIKQPSASQTNLTFWIEKSYKEKKDTL
ncbi:MAG: deoxynucleoside kinase [Promethearchaeota archaeon]